MLDYSLSGINPWVVCVCATFSDIGHISRLQQQQNRCENYSGWSILTNSYSSLLNTCYSSQHFLNFIDLDMFKVVNRHIFCLNKNSSICFFFFLPRLNEFIRTLPLMYVIILCCKGNNLMSKDPPYFFESGYSLVCRDDDFLVCKDTP